jgi:hypothetical protein
MYIIPLATDPNQTFSCTIPVDGKNITFYFFLRFNTEAKYWAMDIMDKNKNMILSSIPLISKANLLEQYSYLNIGSAYILKTDKTLSSDAPNEYNLGVDFILVWGDTE